MSNAKRKSQADLAGQSEAPAHNRAKYLQWNRRAEAECNDRGAVMQMAEKQLQAGDYTACLLTLSALQQEQASCDNHIQAMTAICNVHRFAALKQWNKFMQVLSIPTNASEHDTKKQYRKLAAQVHPDKCDLPHAEEAFKLLGKAVAQLTTAANADSAGTVGDREGPAAAWWEQWDTVQPSERKRKFPTSKPSAEDEKEDKALDDMDVKELQVEVRKRQAAVLRPVRGSAEEGMNAFQRQKRLRIARTVLGEKMHEASTGAGRGFY